MLALSVCVVAFAQQYDKYSESYNYQRGLEAYSAGEYEEALQYLNREVEQHTDNAYAYSYIALLEGLSDEYGKALKAINSSMKYAHKKDKELKAFAFYIRALIYEDLERYDEALADLNSAVAVSPKSPYLYKGRAELYSFLENYAASDADYQSILKIDGDNIDARMGLGGNAVATEQYQKALDYANEVVTLYPEQPSAYTLRAKAYAGLKDYSRAASDIVAGVELADEDALTLMAVYAEETYTPLVARLNAKAIAQPNESSWPFFIGYVNMFVKKYDLAAEAFKKSLAIEMDDVVTGNLADCYAAMGDLNSALECISKAVDMYPEDMEYISDRANIYWRMGRKDEAISELTKCIEANPESATYYYSRAWFKKRNNDLDGAMEDFTTAIVFSPYDEFPYLNRGCLYALKGETANAEADWNMCIELGKESEEATISIYAYFYLGQTDKAMELMQKSLDADPEGNYYDAACLYSLMKEKDKAVDYLRKALESGGYDTYYNMLTDSDLDFIRESGEYQETVESFLEKMHSRYGSFPVHNDPKEDIALNEKVVEVPFTRSNGVTKVKCDVNGLPLSFIFDTGAAVVSISSLEATFMYKNGYLSSKDIVGKSAFVDANGDISVGTVINLRKVAFGGLELENVRASVVSNDKAPLLLGQSVLSRLGKIEIDNGAGVLRIITK